MNTKTKPRKWQESDIENLIQLKNSGLDNSTIANKLKRSDVSIQIKLKRLTKKQDTYNKKHRELKYTLNKKFIDIINPKTILDVYAGETSYYNNAVTNDINQEFNTTYNYDAQKLLCKLFVEDKKFDLIDLDPFGSAYDCFHLAIQMAKKGLIITLGEMGHRRWKRLDFVRSHYGIKKLEEFTVENIINEIQRIGRIYKKELTPVYVGSWGLISRVYFKIDKIKITEQWDKLYTG